MKIFICFVALSVLAHGVHGEKVVTCYYGTWATYRQGLGKFDVSDIDTNLCTHLVYTFVGIQEDGTVVSLDPYLDFPDNYGRDNFRKFNELKNNNRSLKTLLAVGGYNEGSAKYSNMAANPTLRKTFIETAKAMVQTYGFDGLDIDWEYPNQRDTVHGVADVDNFTQLLKELKEEFSQDGLLVTVAVASVEKSASLSYDVIGVAQNVDYIHLMCYDFHGSWDPVTGHNAGLFKGQGEEDLSKEEEFTVDAAVQYWLNQDCPSEKLVLGMPLYGRTFTLTDAAVTYVGAPASGPGIAGPYTQTNGIIGYNELCEKLDPELWNLQNDDLAKVPYAIQGRNWISYDDPESLTLKVEYLLKYNLAGAMVWSIETDDFNSQCGGQNFPLLRAINKALGNSEVPASNSTSSTTTTTSLSTVTSTTESTSIPPSSPTTTSLSSTTTSLSTTTTSTSSSSTSTTSSSVDICQDEGFTPNPEDCSSFYYCVRRVDGTLEPVLFKCSSQLLWDQMLLTCNYADQVVCVN